MQRFVRAGLGIALLALPVFVVAWTGPTGTAPANNVSAPVNVGSGGQVKQGDFGVLGNFGAGTASPSVKLDVVGGYMLVHNNWASNDVVGINGNQVWNTYPGAALYLQFSNSTGGVVIGGNAGSTNSLNVAGGITARDSVTSPTYCIGASCISSWTAGTIGGSGTAGTIPRFTAGTTLGNSSITSDGVSATANGNFFATNVYTGSTIIQGGGAWVPGSIYTDGNWGMLFAAAQAAPNIAQYAWYNSARNTEYMRIGTTGNVGIGTASPAQKLDVNGYVQVESINGEGGTLKLMGNNGVNVHVENANGVFRLVNSPWNLAQFTVDQTGNTFANGSVTASQFCIGASCVSSWNAGTLGGSGTSGYMPRFTAGTTLGNSSITSDGASATSQGNFFAPIIYDSNNGGYYVNPDSTSNFNSLTVNNINTVNCIASVCPPNAAIRMTPNFHLNAGAGYAVIVNWDNGTTGGSQALRVGNGAGADAFYVTANGSAVATGDITAQSFYTNNWFRVNGSAGIYWQAYGGGWTMADNYWMRTYANNGVWTGTGNIGTNGGLTVGYGGAGPPAGGAIFTGNVGIGQQNPNRRLDVSSNGGSDGLTIGQTADNTESIQGYIDGQYANRVAYAGGCCNVVAIQPDVGTVAIGQLSAGERLEVNGNVLATAFLYSSDRRLKDQITPLTNPLEKLGGISGVSFVWKPGTPKAGQADVGVIAQDVEKVLPEAVHTNAEGMKSVDYAKIVPLLVSAVNEQQKEIEELKAEISALKAR